MKLYFSIHYHTGYGRELQILLTEEGHEDQVHDMFYAGNGLWTAEIDFFSRDICYRYQIVENGVLHASEPVAHRLHFPHNIKEYRIFDTWNLKNFPENYLNNKIFHHKLSSFKPEKNNILRRHTHWFRIEAPLYHPHWRMALLGNTDTLGNWNYVHAVPMIQTAPGIWDVSVEISENQYIEYKYGILDEQTGKLLNLEYGENRFALMNPDAELLFVKADHYFRFHAEQMYHDAGVAVPVFSLRTENGFGTGEFADLKPLADWAAKAGLGIVQILPINDTTATHTWTDTYPYAAISVYALHPLYLSVEQLEYPLSAEVQDKFAVQREALNKGPFVDYEKVMHGKWEMITDIFNHHKDKILKDRNFVRFLKENEEWLRPYAAFCVLRDKYKTPDFSRWKTHRKYIAGKVAPMFSAQNKDYEAVMLHQWVQYQLHLQLKDAVDYMHELGISVKGDLPIGIYRYSVEAWKEPELFGMDFQAGAPPDQFTVLGQNWEFPTYDWEAMKADGYRWWKNRFHALEKYFDAMRIDHILGFFRIWRMPVTAVQGILGYFYPAIPVTLEEFKNRRISFDFERFCKPFVNEQILREIFGEAKDAVANQFLQRANDGGYVFKEEFDTQRKLKDFFEKNTDRVHEDQLMSLAANVLFLTEEREGATVFHPRFNLQDTLSFRYLSAHEQKAVYELSLDYFYKRQDELWYHSAMEKLPVILNATEMLICGEDLGLVPDCVPQVMDELAIAALKVQRMPAGSIPFYNPADAGYLNVITPSTHDSSTLRQWWQEDRAMSLKYFKEQLLQRGTAPGELVPELAEIIMKQHLYNEAMLAIFPLQEFLATDHDLRNPDQEAERINIPAVFPHYWRYRMHLNLDELKNSEKFNQKIYNWIQESGRK